MSKYMITTTSSFTRFIKGTLLAMLLLMPTMAHAAKEAYAVFHSGMLEFYYDENRSTMKYKYTYVYDIPEQGDPGWKDWQVYIKSVNFDSTFVDYRPKSCHAWFYEATDLKAVGGIEYLNTSEVTDMYGMFYNCRCLTSVDVSHFNTEKVTDMSFMFNDCNQLTSLDVSNFNTANVTNMRNMFKGCWGVTSLDTKNFDTKNVTNMCEMFNKCKALESVDLSSFNTENVTDMSYMFNECGALKAINTAGFNTKNVTNMDKMFYGCKSLTELDLSGFNTDNITNMSSLFYNCSSLKSLDLSTFNTENVTNMNGMFSGCSSVTTFNLSSFDTRNVTDMGGMFNGCGSMTSIDLSNFNTENVTDMSGMFLNCGKLGSLDLTNFKTPKVTRLDYMFQNCSSLRTVDLSSFNTCNVTQTNNMFDMNTTWLNITIITSDAFKLSDSCYSDQMFAYKTKSEWVRNGKEKAIYTTEGGFFTKAPEEAWAEYNGETKTLTLHYSNCRKASIATAAYLFPEKGSEPSWREYASDIEQVEIDNYLLMYSVSNCAGMFSGLSNLKSIEGLKYLSTSGVSDMSSMFEGCSSLTAIDMEGLKTISMTNASQMFKNCTSLESIFTDTDFELPSTCDGTDMFAGCSSLPGYVASNTGKEKAKSISNGGYLANKTTDMAWAAYNADTKTLTFYYNAKKHTATATTNYYVTIEGQQGWLAHKDDITTVCFSGSFNSYLPSNCSSWFAGMTALAKIDSISNLNTSAATDMSSMFKDCQSLCSIDLTGFNVSNVTNAGSMFSGCTALKAIYVSDTFALPSGCEGTDMFNGCTSLPDFDATRTGTAKAIFRENGGYLLHIGSTPEAWVEYNSTTKTLTFHYDNLKATCLSTLTCDLPTSASQTYGWYDYRKEIEKVVFDSAFAAARPITCSGWFYEMTKLKNIDGLKYLNTSEVTSMKAMFALCESLTSIDVSTFNTEKVTDMKGMFAFCSALASITLTGINTSAVTSMEEMFGACPKLSYLDLTDFDTKNVTAMDNMFDGDTSLSAIVVSDNFTVNSATGTAMFKDCTSLENYATDSYGIEKAKYTTNGGCLSQVTGDNAAWVEFCNGSKTLTFHYNKLKNLVNPSNKFDIPSKGNPAWTASTYANSIEKVVFDKDFAAYTPTTCAFWFSSLGALTSIDGLENLNTSEVTDMQYMFNGCRLLTALNLKNFNTEKVTSMASMFTSCQKLTSLDLSSFNTEAVTTMQAMFQSCSSLETVNISSLRTPLVTDMSYMFASCNALKSTDLTQFDVAKVATADFMFLNCEAMTNIYVKDNFTLSESCTGDNMFNGCSKLANYDGTSVGKDKAVRIADGGYLTNTITSPWVAYNADSNTLTFYYNDQRDYSAATSTYAYTTDETPAWSAHKEDITTVIFDSSFADATISSCKDMFAGMTALTDVEGLKNLNTAQVTDMQGMFQNCTALTNLDLTELNISKVSNMTNMFSGCSLLATILVSDEFQLADDCDGTDMFSGCEKLTGYDSSSVGKEKAKYISDGGYLSGYDLEAWVEYQESNNSLIFHYDRLKPVTEATAKYDINPYKRNPEWLGLNSIEQVTINPSFANARPTGCYRWFFNMSNLKDINGIEYINTSNANFLEEMFYGCTSLTVLDLSEFNTSNMSSMNGMFWLCSSLETIYAGDGFKAKGTGTNMFSGCEKLTGYNASNVGIEMAKYISDGGYFTRYKMMGWAEYTESNKTLTFHYDKKYDITTTATKKYTLPTSTDDTFWATSSEGISDNITQVVFSEDFVDAKPSTCYKWFSDMKNLTTITGMEYLNTSEATDMRMMFNGCTSLTLLNLAKFNTEKAENMASMFQNCSSLTSLDLSSFNTEKVTDMSNMFNGCQKLISVNVKSFNTEKVTNMSNMFNNCQKLTTIDLSEFNAPEVTSMCSMFKDCEALPALSLTNLNSVKATDMSSMFYGCRALATLDLSGMVTSKVTTMKSMFRLCKSLTSLDLSGFNTDKVDDMSYLLYYCSKLSDINLGTINTPNVTTMANMFDGCEALKTVDVSVLNTAKVTNMAFMFRNCTSLESLDLSTFNTESLTNMGNMFQWSESLKEIDMSGFNTQNVTNMEALFQMGENGKLNKIYVGEDFTVADNCSTTDIFKSCPSLPDYSTKGTGAENANYIDGYFTLRRHFTVGDKRYNADGVNAVCYDDIAFGDADDFVSPCNFKAANKTTYERDVTSNWATVCLPFTFSPADNTSAKFYEIDNITDAFITVKEITDTVTAGRSVLAYTDNSTISISGYTGTRVVKAPLTNANLVGTFVSTMVENTSSNYIISKNKFWNVASLLENSTAKSVKLQPYRAYITTAGDGTKQTSLSIVAGDATDIDSIDAGSLADILSGAEFYDLQGRRLSSPGKGMIIVKKGNFTRKMLFK